MEDNYFDKKFKDILESPPEMQVDVVAIADLKKKLKAIQPPNNTNRLLPWLLLLLLPLFFGLGYFLHHYNTLSHKVESFDELTSKVLLIDTVIEKHITYHYDTIYNIVYHQEIHRNKSTIDFTPSTLPIPQARYSLSLLGNRVGAYQSSYSFPYPFSPPSIQNDQDSATDQETSLQAVSTTPFWPMNALNSPKLTLFPLEQRTDPDFIQALKEELPEGEMKKRSPLYYFVPKSIGAQLNGSPLISPDHDFGGSSYSYGISGIVEFAGGRSLEIGGSLLNMNFETKDPNQFGSFPISAPTDPSDVLHEVKAYFTYLQIPLVVRQRFREEKNLQPMISAGIVAYQPLRQRFIYEYLNATEEYKLRNNFNDGNFSVNNFRLGIGGDYQIGRQLSINSEAFIQRSLSLNEGEYFKLNYWTLQLGVNYNFKK